MVTKETTTGSQLLWHFPKTQQHSVFTQKEASKHQISGSRVFILMTVFIVIIGYWLLPGNVPLPLHQKVDVLDPAVVGVVKPFG